MLSMSYRHISHCIKKIYDLCRQECVDQNMKIYDFFQQEWVDQYMNFGPCLGSQFDDKTGQIHISNGRATSSKYQRHYTKSS